MNTATVFALSTIISEPLLLKGSGETVGEASGTPAENIDPEKVLNPPPEMYHKVTYCIPCMRRCDLRNVDHMAQVAKPFQVPGWKEALEKDATGTYCFMTNS